MQALILASGLMFSAIAAHVSPPTWAVDKHASSIRFSSSFNGQGFSGAFKTWTADIRFDPANLAASSVAVSVDVGSVATGDSDRDQALPTDVFFAAAKFPRATFEAHHFRALGGGRYQAIGSLTLRGVSKPLVLPFNLIVAGSKAKMTASLGVNRLAFGVGQDEWRKTDVVPAAVNLAIVVNAERL